MRKRREVRGARVHEHRAGEGRRRVGASIELDISRRRARSSRAALQDEIAAGKSGGTTLRLDGRVLPSARADGVQNVELVRRTNGDRSLCKRVEKIRVVVKLEVASRRDNESHAGDHRIADSYVVHGVGPVGNKRDVVGVSRASRANERCTMLAPKKARRSRRRAIRTEAWPDEPARRQGLPVDRDG